MAVFPPSHYMDIALSQALLSMSVGEVPVGSVIVNSSGLIISKSHNRCLVDCDPTAHAEMIAIRAACKNSGSSRLHNCSIYVTLEPCAMCSAAISYARLSSLYFGVWDKKAGGVSAGFYFDDWELCRHRPRVYSGIREDRCRDLLRNFFISKRTRNHA